MEEYLAMNQITCQVGAEVECFIFDDIVFSNDFASSSIETTEKNSIGKKAAKSIFEYSSNKCFYLIIRTSGTWKISNTTKIRL